MYAPYLGALDERPIRDYIHGGREPDMQILSRKALRDYWEAYREADRPALEQALKAWYREVKQAQWSNANEVKQKYSSASILKKGRVVFNICGNKFRLVVGVNYSVKVVYIKWLGTHTQYDDIDAEEV
jgi:mRNA interferase HigB